jgi:tetratricopeptide (TPR) repeat protein
MTMRGFQSLISFLRRRYRLVLVLAVLLVLFADLASHWGTYLWAEYRLHTARKALEREDYSQAQELLSQYLRLRPDSAEGHFLSARLARRTGDLVEAARHLQACEKRGTLSRDDLKLEKILFEVQQGNLEQEKFLQDCLAGEHADTFLILEALSQGYTKRYQLGQAQDCLNRMLDRQPDNPYALTRRGWIYERLGNHKDAQADYRHAVSVAPENVLARRFLADSLLHIARKSEEAVEHYEFLHQRQPDDPTITAYLAQCWLEQDRISEARSLVGKALTAHPRDPNLLMVRGLLAQREGELSQAEMWLRQAVAARPSFQPAYYALILVLGQEGKDAEAEKCQKQLQSVEAELKQMDDLIHQAMKEPFNPQLRYEVARLLLKLGEDQEGENWLQMVLLLDPYHPGARQILAERQQRGESKTQGGIPPNRQSLSAGLPFPQTRSR